MKVTVPPVFALFGPVGHPLAAVQLLSTEELVRERAYSTLSRRSGQGNIPTVFFCTHESVEAQGYHVVPVVNEEIDDALLKGLPIPGCYAPAPPGAPVRSLADFKELLPSFINLAISECWNQGDAGCEHDFGLEGVALKYRLMNGELLGADLIYPETGPGEFFYESKCSRCACTQAYPEQES